MNDPVATVARVAAQQLTASYGPGLCGDVETALHDRTMQQQRPAQYIDPVSVGTLIVAIATLAWTIYADLRKETPEPALSAVTRAVRIELRTHSNVDATEHEEIANIVVTEIIHIANE